MIQEESATISFFPVEGALLDAFLDKAEIATASGQEDRKAKIIKELQDSPEYRTAGIAHLVNAFINNIVPQPLLSILKIARKRYTCFALVENPYFDLEDWDGYAAFYARSFTPFKRVCSRVHLLEGDEQCIPALIKCLQDGPHQNRHPQWLQDLNAVYRGFFVLRPYHSCVIGRTVIEFDRRSSCDVPGVDHHWLEESGQPYCTGAIANEFHLSSLAMKLYTAPAVQQNPVVGVCATASVWVASQVLSGRFGLHKHPYNTITRQALKRDQEDMAVDGSDWKLGPGLALHEIKQAFSSTGCVPFICGPSDSPHCSSQARMRFLGYTYVESGLPIVAAYSGERSGHAVTIVGHLLPGAKDGTDAAEAEAGLLFGMNAIPRGRHLLLGQAVQLYYAHNDAYGPFDRLRLLSDREAEDIRNCPEARPAAKKKGSCPIATWRRDGAGRRREQISLLQGFVVPLPPYVQNNRPDCVVLDAITRFDKQFPPPEPDLPNKARPSMLWRCFLASSPDFKQSVVRRGYSAETCRRYVEMHLPLFVWVVEFTVLGPGSHVPYAAPRPIDGEFLYDSTTPFYEPQCISFRFQNCLRDFRTQDSLDPCGAAANKVKCFIPVKTRE